MQEITASITLVASLASLGYVVGRKIPLLLQFPAKQEGDSAREIFRNTKKKLQGSAPFKIVSSPHIILQTLLSKARIFSLRTENKTSQWLESLRKKAQAKKAAFADDYWEQLKKSKEKKRVSG
ncbi:MAG: hypothetical protein A3C82_02280 [Candidatus Wildermuthbacteria bacterium RIFCSPHIGHO2_02_FULL_47_12]|uniref:Uncharacterized protein n=1 Tax=Candidatus Wildermuthbacteria bacterium RIFCSPHIGHO2_02_FULL_47_12 TaxID=1802451 RepID=A0A1G2R2J8_9BACT|nr:MAG: hypothetical protein A3C82_02280 [Candidatus Wildermuthbacteria bacterium RIFCSPHIGHO2_02_FULL_47_12]